MGNHVTKSFLKSEDAPLCIEARGVTLDYAMPDAQISTLKEYVLKSFQGKNRSENIKRALDDISFTVKKGESLSIVGRNGSGKSTLLKTIAGILRPTKGELIQRGRIAPLIELGAGFDPELSGLENVHLSCTLLGLSRAEINLIVAPIREFSELGEFFFAPVKTYSSGMYMRLAFSCATAISADVVLIDEVLAVGDVNFQRKCAQRMSEIKKSGATIVLVSHDIGLCVDLTDRMIVLDSGKMICDAPSQIGLSHYNDLMHWRRVRSAAGDSAAEDTLSEVAPRAQVRGSQFIYSEVSNSQGFTIIITIELFQDFPDPVTVGFSLNTEDGVRIFGQNTKNLKGKTRDWEFLKRKGSYEVHFSINNIGLATGRYRLVAAIHDVTLTETLSIREIEGNYLDLKNSVDPINKDKDIFTVDPFLETIKIVTTRQ